MEATVFPLCPGKPTALLEQALCEPIHTFIAL